MNKSITLIDTIYGVLAVWSKYCEEKKESYCNSEPAKHSISLGYILELTRVVFIHFKHSSMQVSRSIFLHNMQ